MDMVLRVIKTEPEAVIWSPASGNTLHLADPDDDLHRTLCGRNAFPDSGWEILTMGDWPDADEGYTQKTYPTCKRCQRSLPEGE